MPETVSNSWKMGALMSAVALVCSAASMDASALALGRITVQSALGEPLRAEIEIAEINAAEAASLQTKVASPEAFKAAGIEFTPALAGLSITLQRRADGRSYLRLTGNRVVTEPFVDVIVEANWSAGRVSRDYTMLLDPPGARGNPDVVQGAQTMPMVPRPNAAGIPPASAQVPNPGQENSVSRTPTPPAYKAPPAAVTRQPRPQAPAVRAPTASSGQAGLITTRPGDTASKIAVQAKSGNVSLDQMLVALLRQNPDAFIGGNVNRVKSGAVLQIPGQETVTAVTAEQASQIIVAQSADFNSFRRKLASGVLTTTAASADRQASGKVQAKVEDRAPVSVVPDKLTLSKGATAAKSATSAEQQIASTRQAGESASRVAELSKNISDLNKLGIASSTAASSARGAASASVITVPVPAPVAIKPPGLTVPAATAALPAANPSAPASVVPTSPTVSSAVTPSALAAARAAASAAVAANAAIAASAAVAANAAITASAAVAANAAVLTSAASPVSAAVPASAAIPASAASVPTSSSAAAMSAPTASAVLTPAAVIKPVPAPVLVKSTLGEERMDNPFVLPGLVLLMALIGGFFFYRQRKNKQSTQVDSSFLESRLQPDSFFGASGGQRVDTNNGKASGSSLMYSPSQLDATGDVDPVAEADVYLAYGRDLQAEEILKEALRTHPLRVAIHAKLLEIYAKRHDVKAFNVVATDAFKLTQGQGPEWQYITEMGQKLDPHNALYLPGGQPPVKLVGGAVAANSGGFGASTLPQTIEPQLQKSADAVDFNLDFDFPSDEPIAKPHVAQNAVPSSAVAPSAFLTPVTAAPISSARTPVFDDLELDFGDSRAVGPSVSAMTQQPQLDVPLTFDTIAFADDSSFKLPSPTPLSKPPAPVVSNAPLEFDMGDLSLDLDSPAVETSPGSGNAVLDDPLETKFSLAQEFSSLGDHEGARALAEEVLLEAKGPLKTKAQAFLNALS